MVYMEGKKMKNYQLKEIKSHNLKGIDILGLRIPTWMVVIGGIYGGIKLWKYFKGEIKQTVKEISGAVRVAKRKRK